MRMPNEWPVTIYRRAIVVVYVWRSPLSARLVHVFEYNCSEWVRLDVRRVRGFVFSCTHARTNSEHLDDVTCGRLE